MNEIVIEENLQHEFDASRSKALKQCLQVLLKELGWLGDERQLREAMPLSIKYFIIPDFLKTLKTLHYKCDSFEMNLKNIVKYSKPALFISNEMRDIFVILNVEDNEIQVFDGLTGEQKTVSKMNLMGRIYLFHSLADQSQIKTTRSWFSALIYKHNKLFLYILLITFILNLLALALPLFSMAIYDQVIASGVTSILNGLLMGISIAVLGGILLQQLQARMLAYIGVRFNNELSRSVFERLIFLPANYTESASINAQVARIKDFDSIRDFFISPLMGLIFDFPFVLLFLAVITILGGNLVYVPLAMMAVFFMVFYPMKNVIQNQIEQSAYLYNKKQELLLESLQNLRTLKYCNVEDVWDKRYSKLSADTAYANFHLNLLNTGVNIIADFLMMVAATAIVAFGSLKVMSGSMSVGALIAVMFLVWRVLVPLKIFCSSQTKIKQLKSSINQINNLMKIEPERDPTMVVNPIQILSGDIRFNRVSFRYANALDPTLLGVSFTVKAGEIVAIVGRNGSGKSSIFKLLLGLYRPQSGTIFIDSQDIRQMDPYELRHAISYVPQEAKIIFGTIAQNLRFAKATATDNDLYVATELAGIKDDIAMLPKAFDTQLNDYSISHLPSSFLQRLALARAYLRKSVILLLDEPENFLDTKSEQALLNAINYFKGQTTILMITHRPSHLKLADKILFLHEGQTVMSGPSEQILARLPKEFLV